ncbi:DNA-directed RNA polymerase I subunit RPA34.5-domain-containing protein [Lineolata rhizophorae]|uniref:DNA-directed RNA polymerase I subunit RPA34.5-domain-containing protein n=1 Tax=Lineolata rhizophorae TaxID=578093 RepID=A0A6A6P5I3_9PEZI|nr:DNA-directed RNA polymerase I subunit RPA34.5-domain-containing protein [Lineolata rhizophorae]
MAKSKVPEPRRLTKDTSSSRKPSKSPLKYLSTEFVAPSDDSSVGERSDSDSEGQTGKGAKVTNARAKTVKDSSSPKKRVSFARAKDSHEEVEENSSASDEDVEMPDRREGASGSSVEDSKGQSDSGSEESTSNQDSDSTSESGASSEGFDEDEIEAHHAKGATRPSRKEVHRSIRELTPPFEPPLGFKKADNSTTPETANPLRNLTGKQLWHISAPASVPLASIKEVVLEEVLRGAPVLKHNGVDYCFSTDVPGDKRATMALVPTEKGYTTVPTAFEETLHLQQVVRLPNLGSETHHSSLDQRRNSAANGVASRDPRKQPNGLRMRYRPPGFGEEDPGTIDSSQSEGSDVDMNGGGLSQQSTDAMSNQKSQKKRRREEGGGSPEARKHSKRAERSGTGSAANGTKGERHKKKPEGREGKMEKSEHKDKEKRREKKKRMKEKA